MSGVLHGIKVVDFTRVISGPTTTQYLADMGAEVIKIEPPRNGDVMRNITPIKNGQSGFFITLNRGKKGITLDLKEKKAIEIALKLTEWADVVVENFSPGTMKNLGLDYETVKERNPKIIYASLSGYGQYGPVHDQPSYDLCVQADCGLMQMNGHEGSDPCRVGFSVTDYFAGILLANGILGALVHKGTTGKGQFIDVAMFDSGLSVIENAISRYDMLGEIATSMGSRHPAASPHNTYRTKDGRFIALLVIEDRSWSRLTTAMGRPELQTHPELGKAIDRLSHRDQCDSIVEEWTMSHTTPELITKLKEHHLAYGVVKTAKDLVDDPQAIAREMIVQIEQPGIGKMLIPGNPIKFKDEDAKACVRGPAPTLGQHNEQIICELLGFSKAEYDKLAEDGVL